MFDYQKYYKRLSTLINANEDQVWQAIIIMTDGSSPAASGMHLTVCSSGGLVGNIGGGNLEHHVVGWIMENKPTTPLIRTYNLNEEGDIDGVEAADKDNIGMICGGTATVFIEPLFNAEKLYIIGAGHCGKALARVSGFCSFNTTVIDNRADQLLESYFPENIRTVNSDYCDLDKVINFGADTYIVIMTYGHQFDSFALESCLGRPYRYLGMIGSKKKVAKTIEELKDKGYDDAELKKVHAPIGVKIGSKTPYEIAVSVTAEIIKIRNEKIEP